MHVGQRVAVEKLASHHNVFSDAALQKVRPVFLSCREPLHERTVQVCDDHYQRTGECRRHTPKQRIADLRTFLLRLCHGSPLIVALSLRPPGSLTWRSDSGSSAKTSPKESFANPETGCRRECGGNCPIAFSGNST